MAGAALERGTRLAWLALGLLAVVLDPEQEGLSDLHQVPEQSLGALTP